MLTESLPVETFLANVRNVAIAGIVQLVGFAAILILPEEFLVALLRGVTDAGEKQLLVGVESVCQQIFIFIAEDIIGPDDVFQLFAVYREKYARLYAFKREEAWRSVVQAVERCDYISRKEELECDVLAVIVECEAQTSAADVIEFVCNHSFFEDYASCGKRQCCQSTFYKIVFITNRILCHHVTCFSITKVVHFL